MRIAKSFHEQIQGEYHPVTYVYYGADSDQAGFETVCWRMKAGIKPDSRPAPTPAQVRDMRFDQVREDGSNPFYAGGKLEVVPAYGYVAPASTYQGSYWELHAEKQDGGGDGTVPTSSGRASLFLGKHKNRIRQQFRLTGFGHEPSYKDQRAQQATLFGLSKIVAAAKIPT